MMGTHVVLVSVLVVALGAVAAHAQDRVTGADHLKVEAAKVAAAKALDMGIVALDPVSVGANVPNAPYTAAAAVEAAKAGAAAKVAIVVGGKAFERKPSLGGVVEKVPYEGAVRTDTLEPVEMEGIRAEGTRTTMTIPAGAIGNTLPIDVVSERWYSPDLQVVLMTRRSDPRFGETVYRLTNINRSEPAADLFEVPADFRIAKPGSGALMLKRPQPQWTTDIITGDVGRPARSGRPDTRKVFARSPLF